MFKYQKWLDKNIHKSYKDFSILITGANSGIGFQASRYFASLGAKLVWGCRNLQKAEEAKQQLLNEFPETKLKVIQLDVSDNDSIRSCVNYLSDNNVHLDAIYHNAGVMRMPRKQNKLGYDLVMATNLIGTFYLNELLVEHYSKAEYPVHVIFTSSIAANFAKINFKDPFLENHYDNMKIYSYSKFGINQIFEFCAKNHANSRIKFSSVHPGITYTPLITKAWTNRVFTWAAKCFMKTFFHSPEKAALGAVYALEKDQNGGYYGPRGPFGISGYPAKRRFMRKYKKNPEKTIKFLKDLNY